MFNLKQSRSNWGFNTVFWWSTNFSHYIWFKCNEGFNHQNVVFDRCQKNVFNDQKLRFFRVKSFDFSIQMFGACQPRPVVWSFDQQQSVFTGKSEPEPIGIFPWNVEFSCKFNPLQQSVVVICFPTLRGGDWSARENYHWGCELVCCSWLPLSLATGL